MAITYRLVKGSALTYGEIDSNFRQLDEAIVGLPDSAQVLALIDSSHIQARQITYSTSEFVDSAGVSAIIITDVDQAFVGALNVNADTLDGQHGSYYEDYNNLINTPTIPVQNKANIDALNINADELDGQDGSYYRDYNNATNTPTIPAFGTDFVDSAYVLDNSVDSAEVTNLIDSDYVRPLVDRVELKSFTLADSATYNTFPAGTMIFLTDGNSGDPCIAVKDSANGIFQKIALGGLVGGGGF